MQDLTAFNAYALEDILGAGDKHFREIQAIRDADSEVEADPGDATLPHIVKKVEAPHVAATPPLALTGPVADTILPMRFGFVGGYTVRFDNRSHASRSRRAYAKCLIHNECYKYV